VKSFTKLCAVLALVAVVPFACSDDSTPTDGGDGGVDLTPPKVTSVTPIDGFHLDVLFNKAVLRPSAESEDNYLIRKQSAVPVANFDPYLVAPGDTIFIRSISLQADGRTASITTYEPMDVVPYNITVNGVLDTKGNEMTTPNVGTFTGMTTPDTTPPSIVLRSPDMGATGVGTEQPVVVQFSEPVYPSSVVQGLTWTSTGGDVLFEVSTDDDVSYVITPLQALSTNTMYNVQLSGVADRAQPANVMATTNWSFTTTPTADITPPEFDSSSPVHLATNVSVNANLSLTFTEAVDQTNFMAQITPDPGDGIPVWSNVGKTVTFDPDLPLMTSTQYTLIILPGDVRDLSGNGIENPVTVRFTTGTALSSGGIAGTLTGDPSSDFAGDPTGAIVIAADSNPFDENDDFGIHSSDIVAANDTYSMTGLGDGVYYPVSVLDSNNDGRLDPDDGDALGAYGVDLGAGDSTLATVLVSGGATVPAIDFKLFDTSALGGTVSYDGTTFGHYAYIGVFDTTGFDISNNPDFATREYWPDNTSWGINELDVGLTDGTYYIGAYLDLDDNDSYDPATEPAGLFGGTTPTSVTIERGSDKLDVHIVLEAPGTASQLPSGSWGWTGVNHAPWFTKLSAMIRSATATHSSAARH